MAEHTYIRVLWNHQSTNDPIELWSELDAGRFETRKLEYFADGRVGYASGTEEAGGTWLGLTPIPPIAEIAADTQFWPEEVTREAFEDRWRNLSRTGQL
jgi:hypothetical protein